MNVARRWHRRRHTNSNVYGMHVQQTPFGGRIAFLETEKKICKYTSSNNQQDAT